MFQYLLVPKHFLLASTKVLVVSLYLELDCPFSCVPDYPIPFTVLKMNVIILPTVSLQIKALPLNII